MRLLSGTEVKRFAKSYSVCFLFFISWLYLLLPTSAPLALNGLPLDHKIEFLVFVALSLSILVYCIVWYLGRVGFLLPSELPKRPRFLFYLETAAIAVLLTLLVFKFFLPESAQLTSCFEILGVNDDRRCVWLPEGFRLDQSDQVSRFEDSITFGTSGRPWRLASFNDTRSFNYFSEPEHTLGRKIQDLRGTHSHPFSATFRLGEPIAQIIRNEYAHNEKVSFSVRYRGVVEISNGTDTPIALPYSEKEQRHVLAVPNASIGGLRIRYRNFRCADETEETSECARSLEVLSLPLEVARLEVAIVHPSDESAIPLGFAPLAKNRNWILFGALALLEGLAGAIGMLILVIRLYPRLSLTSTRASQFVLLVRRNLKLVLQLALIATISAFTIQAFLGARPILIWLGAAYVSMFCAVCLSGRVNQFFGSVIESLGTLAIVIAVLPALLYLGLGFVTRVTPMNEVRFLIAGDDAMHYATDAMGILEHGSPHTALPFTHYLVKPLFLHSKALYYAIFGGGESYYSFLINAAFICVWCITLVFWGWCVCFKTDVSIRSSWIARITITATSAVAYATLTKDFLVYGASFAGNAFSEGPAWLFAGASFALLITLPDSSRPTLSLWLIGVLFAVCLCFRFQYVMFLPLLGFLCAFLRPDLSWKRFLVCVCLPTLVMTGFFLLFYLFDPPTTREAENLIRGGTPFASAVSWDVAARQATLLFPSYSEFLSAITVILVLVWAWVNKGATKRLIWLFSAYVATIFIFDGVIANEIGYHPRHIVMAFFLNSAALIALTRGGLLSMGSRRTAP